jgi:hypothetical protein
VDEEMGEKRVGEVCSGSCKSKLIGTSWLMIGILRPDPAVPTYIAFGISFSILLAESQTSAFVQRMSGCATGTVQLYFAIWRNYL